MLIFQVERIADIHEEAGPLLLEHWEEIAVDKDSVPLDPDWPTYFNLDSAGAVHCVTARDGGKLIGYAVYFVIPSLHYRGLLVADSDIFWLSPEHRKGLTGVRLLKFAEETLVLRGVNRIVNKVKIKHDVGAIFERMGYEPFERLYMKKVG